MREQRQPLQRRDAAARIQRAFRGWRTRRRVVHQVRDDMEMLVADIRRQVGGEWAMMLGTSASPYSLDWGRDGKLRLPRMEDSLFGESMTFPMVELQDQDEVGSEDEQVTSYLDELENGPTADESAVDQVVGAQATQETREQDVGISDARVSAVEIRETVLQAETSATDSVDQAENMDGPLLEDGEYDIQEILATHSRAEILLELEWARQALRDRRKYLRSKGRVEQGQGHLGPVQHEQASGL